MRTYIFAAGCLAALLSMNDGNALAHGNEKHGAGHKAAPVMKKLHDMMPMYSVSSARLESALERKNVDAAEEEAKKILATIPDLMKAKPHKNIKQIKMYRKIGRSFENEVRASVELARKGDFEGARAAFKRAEEQCVACHGKFR